MKAHTQETQATMTPEKSLAFLKEGNERFRNNLRANRNLIGLVNETKEGQFPFAAVLSCIDSRVPAELVFDQGIGDIFSIRVAGNISNEDVLGSMEFACKIAGTKLVVVLGHTNCGAIKGACDHVELGNLTHLINKIKPSVTAVTEPYDESLRNSKNDEFVDNVANHNVARTIEVIRKDSPIIAEMERSGEIKIVGAMYNVASGEVTFM